MFQIPQTFGIEFLIDDQSVEHLAENSIISPEHNPKVDVSIHLIEKDGVGGGVCVEQAYGLDEVALPLTVAIAKT